MQAIFGFPAGLLTVWQLVSSSSYIILLMHAFIFQLLKVGVFLTMMCCRPPWNATMSVEELDANERQAFLVWRRSLARLVDLKHSCLTLCMDSIKISIMRRVCSSQ